MPRKKKIDDLKQIHAKDETFKPSTLEQIWGETGKGKYGTLDAAEYAAKIKGMNKTDLHAHARSVGVMPNDNYDLLIRKLKQEFLAHINAFRRPNVQNNASAANQKIDPSVLKILSEGR